MPTNDSVEFPGISEPYMKSGKGQEYVWKAHEILAVLEAQGKENPEDQGEPKIPPFRKAGRKGPKAKVVLWKSFLH